MRGLESQYEHKSDCPYSYAWDVAAECGAECTCLTTWLVVSPEYGDVDVVSDDGTGPMEYSRDVVFVEAMSRRDAVSMGVRLFRAMRARYLDGCDNPYTGVTAESQTCSKHGRPRWCKDHYECPKCDALLIEGYGGYDGYSERA